MIYVIVSCVVYVKPFFQDGDDGNRIIRSQYEK